MRVTRSPARPCRSTIRFAAVRDIVSSVPVNTTVPVPRAAAHGWDAESVQKPVELHLPCPNR